MKLNKIFGLYTVSFLVVTILIGVAEAVFGLSKQWIGWIFMALSMGIYVLIGIITRTSDADQYYVAGRGVPAIYNGMATGSDWMSAASFISMGGALSAQGFASCWISSTLFCQEESRAALGLSEEWFALGTVAAGPMPAGASLPRPPLDLSEHLRTE